MTSQTRGSLRSQRSRSLSINLHRPVMRADRAEPDPAHLFNLPFLAALRTALRLVQLCYPAPQ